MAQQGIKHKYVKYTCSMETVQQNGRFTLFLANSSLYILFSMVYSNHHKSYLKHIFSDYFFSITLPPEKRTKKELPKCRIS